jgi:hypothetical protein
MERAAVASDVLSRATFVRPCTADMRRAGRTSAAKARDGRERLPRRNRNQAIHGLRPSPRSNRRNELKKSWTDFFSILLGAVGPWVAS